MPIDLKEVFILELKILYQHEVLWVQ